MKKNSLKLITCIAVVMWTALSCSDKGEDENPSSTSGNAYVYKAMVIGSTGHMTVTATPGDSTDSKVDLTMDGVDHTLKPIDNALSKLSAGDELHDIMFSNGEGDTVTVSSGKDGENPDIRLRIDGHDDDIVVSAFLDGEKDSAVSVYEGESTALFIGVPSGEDSIATKSTYNMIIKGNKFKIMAKKSSVGSNSCVSAAELSTSINKFEGAFMRDGNKVTLSFSAHGIPVSISATISGNKITGDVPIVGKVCRKMKSPDPAKAYMLDENGTMGYTISSLDGGGQVICGNADHSQTCDIKGKEGKKLLDKDGNLIPANSAEYYIDVEGEAEQSEQFMATKVL